MTATTSKLGADMTDGPIATTSVPLLHYQDLVRKAGELRALLARQPAAIDKEAEYALVKRGDLVEHSHPQYGGGLFATEDCFVDAPLPNEASKPAVRNCQTGWADICLMAKHDGVTCPSESCDIDDGVRAAPLVEQDERGAFEAWARRVGSCNADRTDMEPEKGHFVAGWDAALRAARAASTSANVAQGAEAVGQFQCTHYAAFAEAHKQVAAEVDALRETLGRKTAAPPAQTALTDDARDAARYRFLRAGFGDMGPEVDMHNAFVDGGEVMDRTIDAALTAAQSASGDSHV